MPDKVRMILTRVNDDGTSGMTEQVVEEVARYDDRGENLLLGGCWVSCA